MSSPVSIHRSVMALAWPMMLANLSTPMIGVVDTAVVGQLPDPAYIGAVALGSLIFTFVFWALGFLKMATTGFTAQAAGAGDGLETTATLMRALLLAAVLGFALIVVQWPVQIIALELLAAPQQVEALTADYFDIRIWAAPATLTNYVLAGWFVGLGRTRVALLLQLVLNLSNMFLDAAFVLVLDMDVRGVALGTLCAEWLAALVGLWIAAGAVAERGRRPLLADILDTARIRRMLAVNRDIMVRSLSLLVVWAWFMSESARQGEVVLAANSILMHFIAVGAFFLDGIAHAAQTLVGNAVGAGDRAAAVRAARVSTVWAAVFACVITLVMWLAGQPAIDLMTVDVQTRALAGVFLAWAVIAPLLGVWAFQLDGIFVGATRAAEMRSAMLLSLLLFLCAWWLAAPWGNQGLWAAMSFHYLARAATLLYYLPRLVDSIPPAAAAGTPAPKD